MEDVLVPIVVIPVIFLGLPWLIFHYITQWKKNGSLTVEDERALDDLHEMARRMDDRLATLERILNAEDPTWRPRQSPDRTHGDDWRRDN
ncbi:envelope stress response membrane protein PspB [Sphingomonas crocodyli]|uniref:Envelope stress response membrane protein PspB n=1 Tax=Sphingomonas crocodyli TaxID=1979270 RepID=A0A437LWQ9_9SPHN|nr:envelope stress response membrane protein PspB [Sphingomonas crocodyli]RVT89809.1 envelope stress response membrane protein PspB [Sphingomonas crocodyli]